MGTEFATVMDEGGVRVRSAEVNDFTLAELRFPPDLVQDTHDPELPYVAFVLDGSLAKSFPARTIELDRAPHWSCLQGPHMARASVRWARGS